MFGLEKTWRLDPRLEADTHLIFSDDTWQTRLMDDSRWPWVIVVPIINDVVDIDDSHRGVFEPLLGHLADISKTLKAMGLADKTNVATLGNVVNQLHWHVVGRNEGDPNWPGPVWGFGEREPYAPGEADEFIATFRAAWKDNAPLINRLLS